MGVTLPAPEKMERASRDHYALAKTAAHVVEPAGELFGPQVAPLPQQIQLSLGLGNKTGQRYADVV